MELKDYLRILRKRGWIILMVGIFTAAAAFGFSQLQTVEYKSSIQVLVTPDRNDNGTLLATKALLGPYAAYINSTDFAQKVLNNLHIDMLPETLKKEVTIASKEDVYQIQIDVVDTDGEQANNIAQNWAQSFVEWRQQENTKQLKQDRVSAFIVQPATYGKFKPQTTLNVAAGGIIGLMLGTLIVFFLESIEVGILRAPDDVEHLLGLTVLGAIPIAGSESGRARRSKSTA